MTKKALQEKTRSALSQTGAALQTVYDALNSGQQKKLLKDEAVLELLTRYGVVM